MSYLVPVYNKFTWQDTVKDKDLSSPPGTIAKGDRYIVASGASGAWSGHAGDITYYDGSSWQFITKKAGMQVYVVDESAYYAYTTTWQLIGTPSDISSTISSIAVLTMNIMLNAFRIAQQGSLTLLKMVDGFMDEYEDESGINTSSSTNEQYNSTDDYYSPTKSGIDSNTKLMLPLDNTLTDVALNHTVSNNGCTFSSSEKKFGSHSLQFNGSSDYLYSADSSDWDIFASASENWTIDAWVNFSSLASNRTIVSQFEDSDSGWQIVVYTNGEIIFGCLNNGEWDVICETGAISGITTGTWYHIACVKNGSTYGIYLDGVQKAYLSDASTRTYAGNLFIGKRYSDYYMNGYLDDIRIQKSNIFSASPNSGKTDTITVPTQSHATTLNMTLISNTQTTIAVPVEARIILFEEDVDSITLNTDLKAYVSRNGGTTFTQITLADEGNYISAARILSGTVDISGQSSGTSVIYKIETLNNKNLKNHGTAVSWK